MKYRYEVTRTQTTYIEANTLEQAIEDAELLDDGDYDNGSLPVVVVTWVCAVDED